MVGKGFVCTPRRVNQARSTRPRRYCRSARVLTTGQPASRAPRAPLCPRVYPAPPPPHPGYLFSHLSFVDNHSNVGAGDSRTETTTRDFRIRDNCTIFHKYLSFGYYILAIIPTKPTDLKTLYASGREIFVCRDSEMSCNIINSGHWWNAYMWTIIVNPRIPSTHERVYHRRKFTLPTPVAQERDCESSPNCAHYNPSALLPRDKFYSPVPSDSVHARTDLCIQ